MAVFPTFTTDDPSATHGPEPIVLGVSRPEPAPAPAARRPTSGVLEEGPAPPVILQIPDLAAAKPGFRGLSLPIGQIAQWLAIGLGALVALWLNFGGHRPPSRTDDAPAWTAPERTKNEAPMARPDPPRGESEAPAWTPPANAAPLPNNNAVPETPAMAPEAPPLPEYPSWEQSSGRGPAPGGPVARTAERPAAPSAPTEPVDAQPLGVTISVPQ